jgi:hypothetical protein
MNSRSTVQNLWRAARDGLARVNHILVESAQADDAVLQAPPRGPERTSDVERRIADARKARSRN